MKTVFCLLAGAFLAISASAQSITINFKGNKNFQAVVDGRTYTPTSNTYQGNSEIVISDLTPGAHRVQIFRLNANNNRNRKLLYSSNVNLDVSESVMLTVAGNGRITREESSSNAAYGTGYRTPMTSAEYSQLYANIRNQWGQNNRMNLARSAFQNTASYFTTSQVAQIIQLLNAEAFRLELARLAYAHVTDPANYVQVTNLLSSQASRNELNAYIRSGNYDVPYSSGTTYRTPMTDTEFNTLYQNIRSKWLPGGKMSAAATAFNTATYYFTTMQARQIIGLLSNEQNRLDLAKLSFDNITDPQNFRQLYDLFPTQAIKDELDAYLRSQYNYQY